MIFRFPGFYLITVFDAVTLYNFAGGNTIFELFINSSLPKKKTQCVVVFLGGGVYDIFGGIL